MTRQELDLTQLAPNGLRRGYTTGTCATAAVQAALHKIISGKDSTEIKVLLPDEGYYLFIPIDRVQLESDGAIRADVIKDAGEDPDQTHHARIYVRVRRNQMGKIVIHRGKGVGLVTEPGLQIPIGEPAVNPVPRQMIMKAVRQILEDEDNSEQGFDLEIGCENGEEIAKRTFNPRLGILGGISILGTSGIVEPKSLAAFKASVEIYIRVALGDRPLEMVLSPGNLGQRFAREHLELPIKRVVQMSNFIGFAIDCVSGMLSELDYDLPRLWMIGHPGKLAKVLDNVWDTHSQESGSAIPALIRVARELNLSIDQLDLLERAKTVEHFTELLDPLPIAPSFWREVEDRIGRLIIQRVQRVDCVKVRLFRMDARALGTYI